jgi:squalene-associated FAD-dependent desaturase
MPSIAVIGGGWAGCAAAVELSMRGHAVTIFEAARTLGGRARRVELRGLGLDNGQHILLGAYTETLRLMRTVGIDPRQALLRLPLQMRYAPFCDGMDFLTPRLPAPFHMLIGLLRTRGLGGSDKLALARFSSAARWMGWQMNDDCSVVELLDRFDQTERLNQLMWRPLCIAALNTPPERASAQIFLNVLRDSLGSSRRAASDMLIPKRDLTAAFPQRAAAFVESRRGSVRCGVAVKQIQREENRWRLGCADGSDPTFDAVVVATQASHAAELLADLTDVSALAAMNYEPITTCYLQYDAECGIGHPFYALRDVPATMEWGQFVFDRGMLDPAQRGLLSVVVSASAEAIAGGHEKLAAAIATQLAQSFRQPELARPLWTKVVSEKRASFSCIPGLKRPPNAGALPDLALAGDYTASDYPATLEAAIRSGVQAAACLIA